MHKKDLITFKNRLSNTFMDTTFTLNDNLATRYKMKKKLEKYIKTTHTKLYYSMMLESLIIVVLSLLQIFYLKRILENKQII